MIDPIIFFGFLACFALGGMALATGMSGIVTIGYNGKHLKGGWICAVCGKPIIGKNTPHMEEECVNYRSRPYQPDHSCFYGAEEYTRMPDYQNPSTTSKKERT